jgi:hypothetical protein
MAISFSKPLTPKVELLDVFGRELAAMSDSYDLNRVGRWMRSIMEAHSGDHTAPDVRFDPDSITDENWRAFYIAFVRYLFDTNGWKQPGPRYGMFALNQRWAPLEKIYEPGTSPSTYFLKYNIDLYDGELSWI